MSARAALLSLFALLLGAACEPHAASVRPAPPPRPARAPTPAHGAGHADPEIPLALIVDSRSVGDEVEITVRVTPSAAFATVILGVDVPQELAVSSSTSQRVFERPSAGAPLVHQLRLRRASQGTAGVALRAWVEARSEGVLFGDERALTVMGVAPARQTGPVERTVVTPTGQTLHDTEIR